MTGDFYIILGSVLIGIAMLGFTGTMYWMYREKKSIREELYQIYD